MDRTNMLAAALALFSLSGCVSVGPDFTRPDPSLPSVSFFGEPEPAVTDASLAATKGDLPPTDPTWWAAFHDPILTSLAERSAAANLDVAAATLRLIESRVSTRRHRLGGASNGQW